MFVQLDAAIVGIMTNIVIMMMLSKTMNVAVDLFRAYTPYIVVGSRPPSIPARGPKERRRGDPHTYSWFL